MKKSLLAFTVITAAASPAMAGNYINLDSGGVSTLTINQDTANNSNAIGSTKTPVSIGGSWKTISVNQYGGGNTLSGSVMSSSGSTKASISATYGASGGTGGFNVHSLTVGQTNAPVDPSITVSMVNNATTPDATSENKATDVLDTPGALTYSLTVNGNSNTLANTVSAGDTTKLTESITSNSNTVTNKLTSTATTTYALNISGGDSNTIKNTVNAGSISMSQTVTGASNSITDSVGGTTAATSYSETLNVTGSNNTIKNTVDGTGAKTANVILASSGNAITNTMSNAGEQSSTLQADSTSLVKSTVTQSGATDVSDLILTGFTGGGTTQGKISVTQSGDNQTVNLTVNGGAYTTKGITVTQSSSGATLTATVNGGTGYAYTISQ